MVEHQPIGKHPSLMVFATVLVLTHITRGTKVFAKCSIKRWIAFENHRVHNLPIHRIQVIGINEMKRRNTSNINILFSLPWLVRILWWQFKIDWWWWVDVWLCTFRQLFTLQTFLSFYFSFSLSLSLSLSLYLSPVFDLTPFFFLEYLIFCYVGER